MKWIFSIAVYIPIFILSSNPQRLVNDSSSPAVSGTNTRERISRGEMTSLSGLPNGLIFVGGYAVREGSDSSIKEIPLLWKIENSSTTVSELKTPYHIDECHWLNERTGWCYSFGRNFYKTTDGGSNWVKEPYFGLFFFLDKTHGWYFKDRTFLMGINGKETVNLARFDGFPHPKQLQFVSKEIGWLLDTIVMGPTKIEVRFQKSEDSGKSWKRVEAPFTEVDSFQFLNETDGFISTKEGLYATVNGGVSWDLVLDIGENEWIDRTYFLSPDVGWTYGNRICMTLNGGHDWKCEKRPAELDGDTIKGFVFTNETNGWLLVDDRLYFTVDSGKSWKRKLLSYGKITF